MRRFREPAIADVKTKRSSCRTEGRTPEEKTGRPAERLIPTGPASQAQERARDGVKPRESISTRDADFDPQSRLGLDLHGLRLPGGNAAHRSRHMATLPSRQEATSRREP